MSQKTALSDETTTQVVLDIMGDRISEGTESPATPDILDNGSPLFPVSCIIFQETGILRNPVFNDCTLTVPTDRQPWAGEYIYTRNIIQL